MTPGELNKIKSAVAKAAADLLARETNAESTAESVAEELAETVTEAMVLAYDEIQAKSYNTVVVGHFRLESDQSYAAAVGPLSTRAHMRAKAMGERFAWDYKSRRGTGKYVVLPLIRDPNDAWDHLRAEQVPPPDVREGLQRAYSLSLDPFGPTCICGLNGGLVCPRHPEGHPEGRVRGERDDK